MFMMLFKYKNYMAGGGFNDFVGFSKTRKEAWRMLLELDHHPYNIQLIICITKKDYYSDKEFKENYIETCRFLIEYGKGKGNLKLAEERQIKASQNLNSVNEAKIKGVKLISEGRTKSGGLKEAKPSKPPNVEPQGIHKLFR